jgi:hypothetical protein
MGLRAVSVTLPRQRGIDGEGLGHLVHSLHLLAFVLIDELAEQGWNVKRAAPLYCASGAMDTPDTGGQGSRRAPLQDR